MYKKNNFNFLRLLFLITIAFTILSCSKEEPPKFSGENFLYFSNVYDGIPELEDIATSFELETTINFLFPDYQRDTVSFNVDPRFYISIQTDGKLQNVKRSILLKVEGNGIDYAVLPPPDSMYIPANGTEFKLNLELIRPPMADTSLKTLTLWLKNNDHFSPEHHIWSKVTYQFGNLVTPPIYYDFVEEKFGDFSAAKMYAIQAAVDRTDPQLWQNDPDVIDINGFLKMINQKEINFNSFALDEIYKLVEIGYRGGPVRDAYYAVINKMISLTKVYISEQKAAGTPVLDESGKEIFFP